MTERFRTDTFLADARRLGMMMTGTAAPCSPGARDEGEANTPLRLAPRFRGDRGAAQDPDAEGPAGRAASRGRDPGHLRPRGRPATTSDLIDMAEGIVASAGTPARIGAGGIEPPAAPVDEAEGPAVSAIAGAR